MSFMIFLDESIYSSIQMSQCALYNWDGFDAKAFYRKWESIVHTHIGYVHKVQMTSENGLEYMAMYKAPGEWSTVQVDNI